MGHGAADDDGTFVASCRGEDLHRSGHSGGGGQVVVSTTTNAGLTFTAQGAALAASFVNGDTLTAFADGAGLVYVFKTTGTTTTYLGSVQLPTTGTLAWTTGGGRIGMQLTNGARVDSFAGGSL